MPRPETIRRWTERLRRFEQSPMTVAQFCRAEGVSQPSFYHWRRELREKPLRAAATFLPVTLPAQSTPTESTCQKSPSPPHSQTTIELPGGIRIHIEVAAQALDEPEGRPS